jgi:hypothetical protein
VAASCAGDTGPDVERRVTSCQRALADHGPERIGLGPAFAVLEQIRAHLFISVDPFHEVARLRRAIWRTMFFVRENPDGSSDQSFDVILVRIHQQSRE